ncbi:hypothetical protein HOA55_00080 [archaeon]|jgi:hypothetical protein|nr:hypothetical protein [archaeon]MBT3577899.1 hypothetical protein [archaeon]MBT6819737.1 hypothetical protein [archaeon]MBT6956021.1 hypothetical protein [archaeon]MBT7025520.1 hypothetical protein [archaeon]
MAKSAIYLGIAWLIFAAWLFYVSRSWIALGVNAAIGIALILLHKEEDKIEERKDINKPKAKKEQVTLR